jgi:hypothetical protein
MNVYLFDPVFLVYLWISLVSSWGAFLFSYRIYQMARHSPKLVIGPLYAYVTVMLYGITILFWTNIYVRVIRFTNPDNYFLFTTGPHWFFRCVIFGAAISAIVVHMTIRFFKSRRHDE